MPYRPSVRLPRPYRPVEGFCQQNLVGGKDNFAADRELGERLIEALPDLLPSTVENKEFLARTVTWAASQGIRQFIDVGCGMPTAPTTGDVAREVHPDARVAYIDSDPVVVSHLDALLDDGTSPTSSPPSPPLALAAPRPRRLSPPP